MPRSFKWKLIARCVRQSNANAELIFMCLGAEGNRRQYFRLDCIFRIAITACKIDAWFLPQCEFVPECHLFIRWRHARRNHHKSTKILTQNTDAFTQFTFTECWQRRLNITCRWWNALNAANPFSKNYFHWNLIATWSARHSELTSYFTHQRHPVVHRHIEESRLFNGSKFRGNWIQSRESIWMARNPRKRNFAFGIGDMCLPPFG